MTPHKQRKKKKREKKKRRERNVIRHGTLEGEKAKDRRQRRRALNEWRQRNGFLFE